MAIPTRNNPKTSENKPRPYKTFYTPKGRTGKIERYEKGNDEKQQLDESPKYATLCVTYYKYAQNEDEKTSFKSSEYFLKSDNIAIYKTTYGKTGGEKVYTGKASDVKDYFGKKESFSTGSYLYVLELETGLISRIQLTAGQNSIWFDFKKEIKNEYPYFYITMRETDKADKRAAEEKYGRSVNIPDYAIVFHEMTGEQDDTAAENAANVMSDFFGGTYTSDEVADEYDETEAVEHGDQSLAGNEKDDKGSTKKEDGYLLF